VTSIVKKILGLGMKKAAYSRLLGLYVDIGFYRISLSGLPCQ
jgi:hypothetical protein